MGSNNSLDWIPTTGGTKALTEVLPYFSTMFWNYFIYSLILQFKNPVFLWHDLNPLFLEGTIFRISKILRDVLATRSRLMLSVRPHKCIWQDCVRLLELLGRGLNEDGTDILSGFLAMAMPFVRVWGRSTEAQCVYFSSLTLSLSLVLRTGFTGLQGTAPSTAIHISNINFFPFLVCLWVSTSQFKDSG